MKNLLFPKGFQIAGWLLFVPALIMAVLFHFEICSVAGYTAEIIINDMIIIGIAFGAVFIVCSKEPQEDEMTLSIRLSALLDALYIYVILLAVCTILVNGFEYLEFMMVNLVLLPVISVIIYRMKMYRYHKMCEDEE